MTAADSRVALVGMGTTEMVADVSERAGVSAMDLACEAVGAALADVCLAARDVDGLLVGSSQGVRPDRLGVALATHAGFGELALLEHIEIKGATTIAMLHRAGYAIAAGEASTVMCVFADAPLRPGRGVGSTYAHSGGTAGLRGLERASGMLGSVPTYALLANRWLHVRGGDAGDLAAVAITARQWAAGNPQAVFPELLDLDGYHTSPMVAEPLRRVDCARPVNGAVAVVLTGEQGVGTTRIGVRGIGGDHPVRRRRAGAESWFGGGVRAVEIALERAGCVREDLDVVQLYDPFSVVTLALLDEYRLTGDTPTGEFVKTGQTAPGGALPTNTGGGQLAGFYLQGMTPLVEAVVQLRGGGGRRQVPGATTALVGGVGGRLDHHAAAILERVA